MFCILEILWNLLIRAEQLVSKEAATLSDAAQSFSTKSTKCTNLWNFEVLCEKDWVDKYIKYEEKQTSGSLIGWDSLIWVLHEN